jgi:hypothetical protein
MKKIVTLFAAAMLASSVIAGPVTYDKNSKAVMPPPQPETCFGPGFDIGIFGAGFFPKTENGDYKNGGGGGLLAEYFFCNYVGIQGSYAAVSPEGTTHIFNGDIVLRFPIESLCIAPYIIAGGGGSSDGEKLGSWQAGGGLDVRFHGSPIGIFADGTYNWHSDENSDKDYTLVRIGLKYKL